MGTKTAKNGTAKRNGVPKAVVDSDILTLEEAAAFLRVPAKGLQKDAADGHIPSKLVAGEFRFSKEQLRAWLGTPSERKQTDKEWLQSIFGLWKDDPTVDEMMREIERRRETDPVAGG
jgi:excisionase family DNA binding protein